jgi:hypothetical protein
LVGAATEGESREGVMLNVEKVREKVRNGF